MIPITIDQLIGKLLNSEVLEMTELKVYIICDEHVEYALDDYVDYNELAPDVVVVNDVVKCDRCDQPAKYKLVPQV